MNVSREVSYVEPEIAAAITKIEAVSPRMSRSSVIAVLLAESPRVMAEVAKLKPRKAKANA